MSDDGGGGVAMLMRQPITKKTSEIQKNQDHPQGDDMAVTHYLDISAWPLRLAKPMANKQIIKTSCRSSSEIRIRVDDLTSSCIPRMHYYRRDRLSVDG